MSTLLTTSAGTYIVTITQLRPSGNVNTLYRTDWMIAFTVSTVPTIRHSQTAAMAPGARRRSRTMAASARTAVTRSPSPTIVRNSAGTPGSTAPGARIVAPATRNTWTQSSGTSAAARGSPDSRGTTYQAAISA